VRGRETYFDINRDMIIRDYQTGPELVEVAGFQSAVRIRSAVRVLVLY
jgi:hypothetical protein